MEKLNSDLFGISEDHIKSYQSLDLRFIKNKAATFFFEAEGDAMAPYVLEKDVLIVDRSLDPQPGSLVIASVGSDFYCRRLEHSGQNIILRAENPIYPDIEIKEQDLQIFGVVRSFVRDTI